jgi:hypothetical protein
MCVSINRLNLIQPKCNIRRRRCRRRRCRQSSPPPPPSFLHDAEKAQHMHGIRRRRCHRIALVPILPVPPPRRADGSTRTPDDIRRCPPRGEILLPIIEAIAHMRLSRIRLSRFGMSASQEIATSIERVDQLPEIQGGYGTSRGAGPRGGEFPFFSFPVVLDGGVLPGERWMGRRRWKEGGWDVRGITNKRLPAFPPLTRPLSLERIPHAHAPMKKINPSPAPPPRSPRWELCKTSATNCSRHSTR